MHGALTIWRLPDGTSAADVARAAAGRLASADPAGVVGAFLQQTAPDAVAILVVTGPRARPEAIRATLAGLVAKLAGRAEPGEEQEGEAWDLLALAHDGGVRLR